MKQIFKYSLTCMLVLLLVNCAVNRSRPRAMTRTYFEYCRGKSFPLHSDIGLVYGSSDYTLRRVYLEDESFFPDGSIIPNAFLSPLLEFRFGAALNAFTEPYYGYRLFHFLKKNPRLGIGVEFIHHKVFLLDKNQRVEITGTYDGQPINRQVRIGDYLEQLNVSHGINHVGIILIYRWMWGKTPYLPDGRWQPFVSVSAGPTAPHLELNLAEPADSRREAYTYQWSRRNWGLGLGLGIRFKHSRNFGLYMEYKATYSHLHGMHFDSMPDTRVTMDFVAHHIQWGISLIL